MQKKKTGGNLLLLCSVLALCFVSPVYANEVATKIESLSDFLLQIVHYVMCKCAAFFIKVTGGEVWD